MQNSLEKLYEKTHPLFLFQNNFIYQYNLNNLKNLKNLKNSKKITLSHTSNQILNHNDSLRRIRRSFNFLIPVNKSQIKRIYAKKSMASFNIQKNNLLGLKRIINGYNYYDFIQKNLIFKRNISKNSSIKQLIKLKEIDKEYDLILRIFPNLNQLGCRIRINNITNIELKILNLKKK